MTHDLSRLGEVFFRRLDVMFSAAQDGERVGGEVEVRAPSFPPRSASGPSQLPSFFVRGVICRWALGRPLSAPRPSSGGGGRWWHCMMGELERRFSSRYLDSIRDAVLPSLDPGWTPYLTAGAARSATSFDHASFTHSLHGHVGFGGHAFNHATLRGLIATRAHRGPVTSDAAPPSQNPAAHCPAEAGRA